MKKLTFLVSAMLFAVTSVFADGFSLQDVIGAVETGDIITVPEDLELSSVISLGEETYTIDLNGKTLTIKDQDWMFRMDGAGDVTIKNGTLNTNSRAIRVAGGKLKLEGVKINSALRALQITADAQVTVDAQSELVVSGEDCAVLIVGTDEGKSPRIDVAGKIEAKSAKGAIEGNASPSYKGEPIVNILEGANLSSASGIAIYQPAKAALTISGGTITGATAVYAKSGSVTISGGKLVANGEKAAYQPLWDGAAPTGDALVIDNCDYPGGAPTVSITGGEFVSANAEAVASYTGNGIAAEDKVVGFVEGGSFSSVAAELIKTGYVFDNGAVRVLNPSITFDPAAVVFESKSIIKGEDKTLADQRLVSIALQDVEGAAELSFKGEASIFKIVSLTDKVFFVAYETKAAGEYSAVVEAKVGEVSKELPVSLVIAELQPSIEAADLVFPDAILKDGKASGSAEVMIVASNLLGNITATVKGSESIFTASVSGHKLKVDYSATKAGEYNDVIELKSGDTKTEVKVSVKVAEEVVVVPAISVNPASIVFDEATLKDGKATGTRTAAVTVSNWSGDVTAKIEGSNSIFAASLAGSTLTVSYTATAAGTYTDNVVLTAGSATTKVALSVKVNKEGDTPTEDFSKVNTSNVTLGTDGEKISACKVVIGGTEYDGIKAGTGSVAGSWKLTVPAGTEKLYLHAAGWKSATVVLSVTGGNATPNSLSLKADDGMTQNSPFTLAGNPEDYFFTLSLSGLSADTELTFTADETGKRFVIWGVNVPGGSVEPGPGPQPETGDTLTVSEALALWEAGDTGNHYVVGLITEIKSTAEQMKKGYCNFFIADEADNTQTLNCFKMYWQSAGTAFVTGEEIKVGDKVLVYGKLTTYNDAAELAEGYVKLFDGSVEPGPGPEPQPVTGDTLSVSQLLDLWKAGDTGSHYVVGIVDSIRTTVENMKQYGNCDFFIADIDDPTKSVICYRLNWMSADGKFTTGTEMKVGDKVLVYAKLTTYKDAAELIEGYVMPYGAAPVVGGISFTANYMDAYYEADYNTWFFELAVITDQDGNFSHLAIIDVAALSQTKLSGSYTMKTEEEDYGFAMVVNAPGDTTTVEFATASLKLDYVGQDEVDYPTYNVTLTATTTDGKSVSVTASALQAVAYDDATGEEIEIVEAPNALEDFEAGKTTLDITKPMYNAQGMLVDENYRGVVIQNGKKYLLR